MTGAADQVLSVVVERDLPHPPEKVWRALTQPHLIEEWLMKSDFRPAVGHRFGLRPQWGTVDCEVRTVEEHRTLSYSWNAARLQSVVTWTLTRTATGTRLRLEQTGFRADQPRYFEGAKGGWPLHLAALERTLAQMD